MSFLAHRRFRRVHALLLCTLWLVGFEVGPGLHVALHAELGHHHHGSSSHGHVEADVEDEGIDEHPHHSAHHEHTGEASHHHGHDVPEPSHHGHGAEHHGHHEPQADHHAHHEVDPEPATDHEDEPGDDERPTLLLEHEADTAVAYCTNDLSHGAHSLAHRGIAASPTPAAWPPVAVAPWAYLSRASFALDPICSRAPRCARARGPPSLS